MHVHGAHVSVPVASDVEAALADIALVELEVEVGELVVVHVALLAEGLETTRLQTYELLVLSLRFVVVQLLRHVPRSNYFLQLCLCLGQTLAAQFLLHLVELPPRIIYSLVLGEHSPQSFRLHIGR